VNAEYDHRNGRPRLNTFDWLTGVFRTKEHFPRNLTARGSKITTTGTLFALQTRARKRPYWHLTLV